MKTREKILTHDEIASLASKLKMALSDDLAAESIAFAILEIAESAEKIYDVLLPELLASQSPDSIREKLWELREEFRHIEYHIQDGKLTE